MSQLRAIAHNSIIQIAGKIVTIAIGLVAFGMMTRYLGAVGFGYYTTVYGFLVVLAIITDLGLQMTTTQLISDPQYDEKTILSNAVGLRLAASLVFLMLAPLIAWFTPYSPVIKLGIALGAIGFVGSALTTTLTSYFQKHLVIHKLVLAEVGGKIMLIAGVLMAVQLNLGLHAIIAATACDALITCAIAYNFVRGGAAVTIARDTTIWKLLWSRTWPIAVTIGLNLIYFKGDVVIMSLLRTQTEVGLYGAPYRVLEFLINLMYLFLGLLLPLIASAIAVRDTTRLRAVSQHAFDVIMLIGLPLVVGGWLVAKRLMIFVAGRDFAVSGDIMQILLIATVMIFIASLFGYIVVASQQQKRMIKFFVVNAVIAIVGYTIAIDRFGYFGAAWMTVATETLMLLSAGYVMYKSTNFFPRVILLPKIILCCAAMAGVILMLPTVHVTITIMLATLAYAAMLYITKTIHPEVIKHIFKK